MLSRMIIKNKLTIAENNNHCIADTCFAEAIEKR